MRTHQNITSSNFFKNSSLINSNAGKYLIALVLLLASFGLSEVQAQRAYGDVGIGAQVGQPTGLTLKVYKPVTSLDILAAWDLDKFFFLNVHGIFDAHLNENKTIHFFYGPGAFMGLREGESSNKAEVGLSGTAGLDFMIGKFELYLQATPRLSLINSTDFDMGGGVGFRVYL